MDLRFVFNMVGMVICGIAIALLIPAAADAVYDNPDWRAFAMSAFGMGVVGIAWVLATRSATPISMSLRTAFLLTGLCWIALPLLAALPFLGLGLSYADAVFEATSGITTTGSTVLTDLDHLPPGILLWRALLQWIGGVGIIVMAISILPFLRVGGAQLFRSESSDTSDKAEARWFVLVGKIIMIYILLTFLCTMAYWAFGMSGFDAICHAMATISTGGYSTHDNSFGFFPDWRLQWTGTIFMLSGAFPFYIYVKAVRGDFRSLITDSQVRVLVTFLAGVSIAMAIWLHGKTHIGLLDALTLTSFNITSIVTTTGFASTDYTKWGSGAVGLFLILMFVGGCSGSTSGAIKIYRYQVLFQVIRLHIKRMARPHRVISTTFNGKPLSEDAAFSILAFLALFVTTIAACTLILTFLNLDLVTAYSASVTAITNVGPGLGPVIGPAGNFATLPESAKWLLSFAMVLGRLEIFTLLVMLDREFWNL